MAPAAPGGSRSPASLSPPEFLQDGITPHGRPCRGGGGAGKRRTELLDAPIESISPKSWRMPPKKPPALLHSLSGDGEEEEEGLEQTGGQPGLPSGVSARVYGTGRAGAAAPGSGNGFPARWKLGGERHRCGGRRGVPDGWRRWRRTSVEPRPAPPRQAGFLRGGWKWLRATGHQPGRGTEPPRGVATSPVSSSPVSSPSSRHPGAGREAGVGRRRATSDERGRSRPRGESPGGRWGCPGGVRGLGVAGVPRGCHSRTDGGDVGAGEVVLGEADDEAGLAHAAVPDQQQFEEVVVGLGHGPHPPPPPPPPPPPGPGPGPGHGPTPPLPRRGLASSLAPPP